MLLFLWWLSYSETPHRSSIAEAPFLGSPPPPPTLLGRPLTLQVWVPVLVSDSQVVSTWSPLPITVFFTLMTVITPPPPQVKAHSGRLDSPQLPGMIITILIITKPAQDTPSPEKAGNTPPRLHPQSTQLDTLQMWATPTLTEQEVHAQMPQFCWNLPGFIFSSSRLQDIL